MAWSDEQVGKNERLQVAKDRILNKADIKNPIFSPINA